MKWYSFIILFLVIYIRKYLCTKLGLKIMQVYFYYFDNDKIKCRDYLQINSNGEIISLIVFLFKRSLSLSGDVLALFWPRCRLLEVDPMAAVYPSRKWCRKYNNRRKLLQLLWIPSSILLYLAEKKFSDESKRKVNII